MAWTVKWAGCTCTNMKPLYTRLPIFLFSRQISLQMSVKGNLSFFFKYNMHFLLILLHHNNANLPQKRFG